MDQAVWEDRCLGQINSSSHPLFLPVRRQTFEDLRLAAQGFIHWPRPADRAKSLPLPQTPNGGFGSLSASVSVSAFRPASPPLAGCLGPIMPSIIIAFNARTNLSPRRGQLESEPPDERRRVRALEISWWSDCGALELWVTAYKYCTSMPISFV